MTKLDIAYNLIKKSGKKGISVRELQKYMNDVYGTIKTLRAKGVQIFSDERVNLKTGVRYVEYWMQ